jgi:hypothetical protein
MRNPMILFVIGCVTLLLTAGALPGGPVVAA